MESCGAALDPVHAIADILPTAAKGRIDPPEAAARLRPQAEQLHRVSVASRDGQFRLVTNDVVAAIEGFVSRVADPRGDFSADGPLMTSRFQRLLDYCKSGA
jgi:hypothetical protein